MGFIKKEEVIAAEDYEDKIWCNFCLLTSPTAMEVGIKRYYIVDDLKEAEILQCDICKEIIIKN